MTIEHDHEHRITPDGVAPGCPDFDDPASSYVCDGCGDQAEVWVGGRPLCRREPEAQAEVAGPPTEVTS